MTSPDDWIAIADLLARYGCALDDKDWSLLSTCFLSDAVFDYGAEGSYESYRDWEVFARNVLGRYSSTQHLIGSIRITVDGDSATARCYAQAAHVMAESGHLRVAGTAYRDTLARTVDGWRIASRQMERPWGDGPPR